MQQGVSPHRAETNSPSRRGLLKAVLAGAPVLAAANSLGVTKAQSASLTDDLTEIDARTALQRIRRGELQAEAYANRLLRQHTAHRDLNTIITVDEERVLQEARRIDQLRAKGETLGPLAGLPFLVKDQMDVAGYPTTAGDPHLKGYIPKRSATIADIMTDAGAVVFAKANCQDMTGATFIITAVTSSNPFFGFVRNPYDTARIPGGSSGGNGAALAARIVPAAIGEDTGGSVRIPAAFNGVVGFRPSTYSLASALNGSARKRYPDDGMVPPANRLDTWGPMARTVSDVALLDTVISGEPVPKINLRNARIGVPAPSYWENEVFDPALVAVMREAFAKLRDAGANLVEVDFAETFTAKSYDLYFGLQRLPSGTKSFADWLSEHAPDVSMAQITRFRDSYPASMALINRSPPKPLQPTSNPRQMLAAIAEAHTHFFRTHGLSAVAFPTVPITAPLINCNGDTPGQKILVNGNWVDEFSTILTNTVIAPCLGGPALSLPAGLADGLPVGLELEGLPGHDSRILGLGIAVENVLGRIPSPQRRRA